MRADEALEVGREAEGHRLVVRKLGARRDDGWEREERSAIRWNHNRDCSSVQGTMSDV